MAKMLVSKKKAKTISVALFLIGLGITSYLNAWWPGIMLTIGIPIALRQYLLGRHYDMGVSLFVFVGVFITVQFNISWEILLPALFAIGGIYVLFREFLEKKTPLEEQEDISDVVKEKQHKD